MILVLVILTLMFFRKPDPSDINKENIQNIIEIVKPSF